MDSEMISRVTVLAVGVENYSEMRRLRGARKDIENLHRLLVTSPKTALFNQHQFIKLLNPTSEELRKQISDYTLGRSARGDILVFYFSGHGVPVGRNDFGFCTTDSRIHPGVDSVLPLTVVRFSDLLETTGIMDVTPVIIIDACYSGIVGKAVSPHNAITTLHEEIQKANASNYVLLCSCSDLQSTLDSPTGGIFSRCFFDVIKKGIPSSENGSSSITLKQIYQSLKRLVESQSGDATPRLFLGETFSDFPMAKNVQYKAQSYSIISLKCVINVLWNNGNEQEFSASEILDRCGRGAYANHNKLSLEPWQLVEDSPVTKKRRLTDRGRSFAQGKLSIPRKIEKDLSKDKWIDSPGTPFIKIDSI